MKKTISNSQLQSLSSSKEQIKELLAQDAIKEAINNLLILLKKSKFYNELVIQSATFNRINRAFQQGIIDWNQVNRSKNRVVIATLALIDDMSEEPLNKKEINDFEKKLNNLSKSLPKKSRKRIIFLFFIGFSVAFIGLSFLPLFNATDDKPTNRDMIIGAISEPTENGIIIGDTLESTGSGTIIEGILEPLADNIKKKLSIYLKNFNIGSRRSMVDMTRNARGLALFSCPLNPKDLSKDPLWRNKSFIEIAIAFDEIGLYVNKANPIDTLKKEELQNILFGVNEDSSPLYDKWGQVGIPKNHELFNQNFIILMSRGGGNMESGTRFLAQKIMRPTKKAIFYHTGQHKRATVGPKNIIEDVGSLKASIGLSSKAFYNNGRVKQLVIIDEKGKEIKIKRKLWAYIAIDRNNPKLSEPTRKLFNYLLSYEIQHKIQEFGFLRLPNSLQNFQLDNLGLDNSEAKINLDKYEMINIDNEITGPFLYRLHE